MQKLQQNIFFILVGFYFKFVLTKAQIFGESKTTTLSLISDYGYPGEEHKVTTKDNYIVTLFRIPYSPKNNTDVEQNTRPSIFIMHGFGQSSSDWVLSGYPRGLAFFLSDAGYDVWMGNARGTRYSKEHKFLRLSDPAYWDFSWHEIGIYDLPASVDYILQNTASSMLQYIAHSQGTTAFLVATSSLSSFSEKIKSAHLLAPVAFFSQATSIVMPIGAAILGHPHPLPFGAIELLPNSRVAEIASEILCGDFSLVQAACTGLSFIVFGADSEYTNNTAIELYFETVPAGSSIKQLFHFLQLYNSAKFRQFDYGLIENFRLYQQTSPPDYQLENIKAPIYIYYSENDALADHRDVDKLINALPTTTLKKAYKMPFESWNHLDFVLGNNVDELLYSILLDDIKNAESFI